MDIKEFLNLKAEEYNNSSFIKDDILTIQYDVTAALDIETEEDDGASADWRQKWVLKSTHGK